MLMIADRLRGLRGTESQTTFAARLGLKQAIYSHYETGRKKPSLEVLISISRALNVTSDYLLGLSDSPSFISANQHIITGSHSSVAIGTNITQSIR